MFGSVPPLAGCGGTASDSQPGAGVGNEGRACGRGAPGTASGARPPLFFHSPRKFSRSAGVTRWDWRAVVAPLPELGETWSPARVRNSLAAPVTEEASLSLAAYASVTEGRAPVAP